MEEPITKIKGHHQANHRKPKWPIIGTILLISVLLITCYIVIFGTILVDDWDFIALGQEKISDGWLIKISASHKAWEEGDSGFSLHVFYHLTNETTGQIRDIDGRFNENGTIIFFDIDDNNLLNKGDIFFIKGNSDSHIKAGFRFSLSVGIDSTIILK